MNLLGRKYKAKGYEIHTHTCCTAKDSLSLAVSFCSQIYASQREQMLKVRWEEEDV